MVIKTRAHGRPRFEYRLSAGLKTIPGVLLFFHVPSRFLPRSSLPRTSNTCRGLLNSLRHYDSTWLFLLFFISLFSWFLQLSLCRKRRIVHLISVSVSLFSLFFDDSFFLRIRIQCGSMVHDGFRSKYIRYRWR